MSWLSKQLKSAKKLVTHPGDWFEGAGKTVGKALQQAAPIAAPILAATGVGAPLAAGILAGGQGLGSVLQGKNMNNTLRSAAGGAVSGAVGGLTGGAGGLAGGASGAAGNALASTAAPSGIGKLLSGGLGGIVKQAGTAALKNPEVILAGLGAVQNARDASKASKLRDEALGMAKGDYESRAPLRAAALQQLLALRPAQRPDVSAIFSDPGNPYSQAARAQAAQSAPQALPSGLAPVRNRLA